MRVIAVTIEVQTPAYFLNILSVLLTSPIVASVARKRPTKEVGLAPIRISLVIFLCIILFVCVTPAVSNESGKSQNKEQPTLKVTDTAMQELLERIEQAMQGWLSEDLSNALPIDSGVHGEIKRICEEIQQSTQDKVRLNAWPNAEVPLRSISYIVSGSDRQVRASYSSRSDTKILNPEVVWEDLRMEIVDGRLKFLRESGRRVSPFADVMIPILREETRSILESASYATLLSWPISEKAHEELHIEINHVLELYLNGLTDFLESTGNITGKIEKVEYVFWFEEGYAKIRVIFDIKGTQDKYLRPGVELDYKNNKFRLKDLIHSGWSGGVEYVSDASSTAMDDAVEKWVKELSSKPMFEDARVGPPFKWRENAKDLPNNIGRIVHLTQRSHPFLGEHHRKFRIELADGRTKTFRLPTDGGSVLETNVFLLRTDDRQLIRLRDNDRTNLVIALDSLKLCPPAGLPQGNLVLTFGE